jgi:gamma-glutamyltranspeptidase/glutathione hydrolase
MNGVVAAGQLATAEAAATVLEAGGNAVDAAIAGACAAFVAEPLLCSAGGGGLMTIALPDRPCEVVDFFSDAPGLGGVPDRLDFDAVVLDFGSATQEFHIGRGAAAVPGVLDGLAMAGRRHGSRPLAELCRPACQLAADGFRVSAETAMTFELLWPILSRDPDTVAALAPDGRPPRQGEELRNPALAETLEEWARIGRTPDAMHDGLLAAFGRDSGGLITDADLAHYEPVVLGPSEIALGDAVVALPPRVGGKLVDVILRALLAGPRVADEVGEAVQLARASAAGSAAREALIAPPDLPGSTTHVSVLDGAGGVCAVTLSNGEGSGHVIPDTGVQVNNFLGEEDLNPHGFHLHDPGRRLPTMMAPAVVTRGGAPALALGSGGANRIRTALAQVLYRTLVAGLSLEEAVHAPRFHAEGGAGWFETGGLADPDAVRAALAEELSPLHVFPGRAFFFGGVHAVGRGAGGHPHAVGDDRRGGAAIVL